MGFRFFRRIRIAPGVTLNLSKSGVSTSFGPRGAKLTVGSKGTRQTVGIPGTGLFYTTAQSSNNYQSAPANEQETNDPKNQSLNIGFFKSLVTSEEEKAFVEGCKALLQNDTQSAYTHFKDSNFADSAFMAGIIAFKHSNLEEAEKHFLSALERKVQLGGLFNKYGIEAGANIPITDEIMAFIQADSKGILLALTEIYQQQRNSETAFSCLFNLRKIAPDDILVKLSLIEMYFETGKTDTKQLQAILNISHGIENDSLIHAAVLLYRARALRMLGLNDAAREILTATLRKRKNLPLDLLNALQYERALVYEALGNKQQARKEFEKIYAENPDYEDLSNRLGLD